ncbi:MAG: alcohol dehydrogenase catalytic domain-containing protein [Thermomicrobiales bacterium]
MNRDSDTTDLAMSVTAPGAALVATPLRTEAAVPGWVRIRIAASGVCHADLATVAGKSASPEHPVTPGHEIAGVVEALGSEVPGWAIGDRAAVGWFGGSCGHCHWCRSGHPVHRPERKIPGISYRGGWAETITVPASALARIPEGLDFFHAAPMGCAGVTTFNALRHADTPAGGRVAVFGIGGLGHLAVQFAARMGFETIAIARGPEREELARELGAHHYLDANEVDPGKALRLLGGADHIISTASTASAIPALLGGLNPLGRLTMIGVDAGTVAIPAAQVVMKAQTLCGHLTGSADDIEQAMQFAVVNGVTPWVERLPLAEANEAVARLRAGSARFRIVLDPGEHAHE